uniref:NELL2-interacting cell ontogeny regulator 1 n=1 Tax=Gallus gallus TaxID=9031 RepID=A0A8V0YX75_CHICK
MPESRLLVSAPPRVKRKLRLGRELELLTRAMALPSAWSVMRVVIPFVSVLGLLGVRLVGASQDSGSVIPAESRPCVDCHAFEFMQRALQDLKKMAYNLDTRVKMVACVALLELKPFVSYGVWEAQPGSHLTRVVFWDGLNHGCPTFWLSWATLSEEELP